MAIVCTTRLYTLLNINIKQRYQFIYISNKKVCITTQSNKLCWMLWVHSPSFPYIFIMRTGNVCIYACQSVHWRLWSLRFSSQAAANWPSHDYDIPQKNIALQIFNKKLNKTCSLILLKRPHAPHTHTRAPHTRAPHTPTPTHAHHTHTHTPRHTHHTYVHTHTYTSHMA